MREPSVARRLAWKAAVAAGDRYVVALSLSVRSPVSYLCAWCAGKGVEGSGWSPTRDADHQVPVWRYERDQAIVFDEQSARRLADEMCRRYRHPPSGIRAYIEELPAT